jgi:Ca2+-binding EF-hand superfamily protein
MENKLKELSEFVCNVVKIENKIAENKLSHSEVKALLQMVDVKGKGFLDLNDVYDLVGKVTENELFTIFKFFDTERTGEIRLQQLQQCLGDTSISSNNTSKEYIFPRFYSIVDTIKDKPKLIG